MKLSASATPYQNSFLTRTKRMALLSGFVLVWIFFSVGFCQVANGSDDQKSNSGATFTATPADNRPTVQHRNPRYQLRKGDSFELQFAFSPEFNQVVAVQPDGYITLKNVGTMFVEGQTIPELTDTIKTAYVGILHDPVITIALNDFEKPYFIAAGQVGKPGKYELRSDLTLTEGIAIAGGLTDASKHSQVVLFRPVPTKGMYEARLINVKKLLKNHDLNEDVQLQPGDMVYVPQNTISKIRRYLPTSSMGLYANPMLY